MITVRFPTGVSIQYNSANQVQWADGHVHLYQRKEQAQFVGWVATVPTSCVIEVVQPCRIYQGTTDVPSLTEAFLELVRDDNRRREQSHRFREIKKILAEEYDGRSGYWRR